jgi:hypothetical protein
LRLLAQVRRIGPDPGIRFSGTRDHQFARRYFSFESRKSWFESNKSCGRASDLVRIWNRLPIIRRDNPHGRSYSMPRARLFASFITGKEAPESYKSTGAGGGH